MGVVVGLGVGALGVGCGGGTTSTSPATTAAPSGAPGTTAPEERVSTAAEVTAGLADVRQQAATIKTTLTTDQAGAEAQSRAMYDRWFEFEGTVRKNDKNLYLQMEDGLAAIKAGAEQNRADKVDKGLKDLEEGATAYLVKFP